MAITTVFLLNLKADYRQQLINSTSSTLKLIANMSAPSVVFKDRESAVSILHSLDTIPQVNYAAIFAESSLGYSQFVEYGVQQVDWPLEFEASILFNNDSLHLMNPIKVDDATVGWLYLEVSLLKLNDKIIQMYQYAAFVVILAIIVVLFLSLYITRGLFKPLLELQKVSSEIATTKNYSLRVGKHSLDEVGRLVSSFNAMLEEVERYAKESQIKQEEIIALNLVLEKRVEERTEQLNKSLNTLKETQAQVIEQEKMASLGNLVAGVSHEINTPLGIAVTVGSTIERDVSSFTKKLLDGTLTRTEAGKFAKRNAESCRLLLDALERSAKLVQNFKQIAVDQTSEERRRFNLKEFIEDILNTLRYTIKNKTIECKITVPDDIQMDSFPGPLGQVITNLFTNSILHGFNQRDSGNISIHVKCANKNIVITFSDDGIGIDQSIIANIYDPFMTTKLGQGGSGLGLNIVRNIVSNVLAGDIQVVSTKGAGCTFTMTIPMIVPT